MTEVLKRGFPGLKARIGLGRQLGAHRLIARRSGWAACCASQPGQPRIEVVLPASVIERAAAVARHAAHNKLTGPTLAC